MNMHIAIDQEYAKAAILESVKVGSFVVNHKTGKLGFVSRKHRYFITVEYDSGAVSVCYSLQRFRASHQALMRFAA